MAGNSQPRAGARLARSRTLLAALACAAMCVTHAQEHSAVEMYGHLDIGLGKRSDDTMRIGRGYNNWLGWRGFEKVGKDLTAFFTVEARFDPDTGRQERAGTLMQGETTVGLRSEALGALRLGRALTPLWQDVWEYEPWINSGLNASLASYQTGSYSSDGVNDVRLDGADGSRFSNAVFYVTPIYRGWSMHIASEVEREAGARRRGAGVAFNYASRAWAAELAFDRNANGDKIRFAALSWESGKLKVMGSVARISFRDLDNERVAMVAARYAFGTHSVRTGYGRNFRLDNDKFSAGWVYHLSKRTRIYVDLYHERAAADATGAAVGVTHGF